MGNHYVPQFYLRGFCRNFGRTIWVYDKLESRRFSTQVKSIANICGFFLIYVLLFIIGIIFMSILGLDFKSALGSVAATIGNIGPGLGTVGPSGNYAAIPLIGKWFLSFLMLFGRLEIYTVIILITPVFWKK